MVLEAAPLVRPELRGRAHLRRRPQVKPVCAFANGSRTLFRRQRLFSRTAFVSSKVLWSIVHVGLLTEPIGTSLFSKCSVCVRSGISWAARQALTIEEPRIGMRCLRGALVNGSGLLRLHLPSACFALIKPKDVWFESAFSTKQACATESHKDVAMFGDSFQCS